MSVSEWMYICMYGHDLCVSVCVCVCVCVSVETLLYVICLHVIHYIRSVLSLLILLSGRKSK